MTFVERLNNGPPLILDGGFGSLLIARGLPAGMPPEQWTLDNPDAVESAHRAYVDAGSQAIHVCTFGANPHRLEQFGLSKKCEAINAAAVAIARRAHPEFVIGDVGPTGEYLPPVGQADEAKWREGFERQGRALAEAGVDAFHIETMIDQREARVAFEALRSVAPELPVMVSLTFDRKKRGFFTAFGDRPVEALTALAELGAAAVGSNCGLSSPDMRDLVGELFEKISVPLVVQPNAGQPLREGDEVRYQQTPDEFAADMLNIVKGGVAAVGGCCGTDPTFIGNLKSRLASAVS